MNDDELGAKLGQSIERRVRAVKPSVGMDELLVRTQRRLARQRRLLVALVVTVLAVGGITGYLVGHTTDGDTGPRVALDDGAPGFASHAPAFEPANVEATRALISQAFHSAFDGGVPQSEKVAAIQYGSTLEPLARESQQFVEQFGYTAEQIAGTSITVLDTSFIDATHAIVHFSLTIPGHGVVLVDRVGYAVYVDGRWKVALRTECDLLSLNGLGGQCPPTAVPGSG
jgi:hypothetical protein